MYLLFAMYSPGDVLFVLFVPTRKIVRDVAYPLDVVAAQSWCRAA